MWRTNQKFTMRNLGGIPPSLLEDISPDPMPRWLRNRRGTLFLILMTLLVVTLNQLSISHYARKENEKKIAFEGNQIEVFGL